MKLSSLFLESTVSVTVASLGPKTKGSRRPNFVLIMSDDQDKHLNSLDCQFAIQKHISSHGTVFESHYCTMAQCCPSRVSFLTGRHGHNTNVTDVAPPYGKLDDPRKPISGRNETDGFDRRVSKIHRTRLQKTVLACVVARCRLQHLICWKAHELAQLQELQQTLPRRIQWNRL